VAAVPAPGWLPAPLGEGSSLAHGDLHPLNVMMTARGPVLIDWTNGCRAPAEAEVALTWIIMATSEIPGPLPVRLVAGAVRGRFVRQFLSHFDLDPVRAALPRVAELRLADQNVTDRERERVRALVARE
jgi:aminoglycoside phosphotransferase (APT) family kinase protein